MKESDKETIQKPMLQQLRELDVDEEIVFPIERASSVKSCCSAFGLEWNKVFKTRQNRAERTLTVKRIS